MIGTHVVSPRWGREPGAILVNTARGARSRAFRTPEAGDNLIGAALVHCRRIAAMVAERNGKDAEGRTFGGGTWPIRERKRHGRSNPPRAGRPAL
jgi:hypothetical protein